MSTRPHPPTATTEPAPTPAPQLPPPSTVHPPPTATTEPPLSAIQAWMQAVLVSPLVASSAHEALPATLHADPVAALIRSNGRLTPREHLAIYQRSYLTRLRQCMAAQFPVLRHALGEELFQAFADQYLQSCPSRSPTLADLGDRFPDHLDQTRPPGDEDWPDFLVELARLEVAVNHLFDAEPPPADGPLVPLLALFAHRFPVGAYYRAVSAGQRPELPFAQDSWTMVVRRRLRVAVVDLLPEQHRLLTLVREGRTLDDAQAALAAEQGVPATDTRPPPGSVR